MTTIEKVFGSRFRLLGGATAVRTEVLGGNRGFRVSAFTSFEEAMEWLSDIVRIGGEMPMLDLPPIAAENADDSDALGHGEEAGDDAST